MVTGSTISLYPCRCTPVPVSLPARIRVRVLVGARRANKKHQAFKVQGLDMALIYTNHGKTIQRPFYTALTQGDRITIVGASGETVYVPARDTWRLGFKFGPTIQAGTGGTVAVYTTNDDTDVAMNPANDSKVGWNTLSASLAAGAAVASGTIIWTVCKLVFNAANRVFISSM